MINTLEYVDVTDKEKMEKPTERQQAALNLLPKIESFCKENSIGVEDIKTLANMLERKVLAMPVFSMLKTCQAET